MSFTLPDNPALRPTSPRHVPTRYEEDGRVFETTGERRRARKGEFLLGIFGVAIANCDTDDEYPILREVLQNGN